MGNGLVTMGVGRDGRGVVVVVVGPGTGEVGCFLPVDINGEYKLEIRKKYVSRYV